MQTEFEKDILELKAIIEQRENKAFRKKLLQMIDKMQCSNTKAVYKNIIDRLCVGMTGEHYETLFIKGIKEENNIK